MAESFVQTQVRLVLEQQCADVFWALHRGPLADRDFTILLFGYGKGNVAFKTKLALSELVSTWTVLLDSWRGLAQRRPVPGLDPEQLNALGREAASRVPAGCGFALLIGRGEESGYIATADRDDMIRLIGNEMLPQLASWSGDVKRPPRDKREMWDRKDVAAHIGCSLPHVLKCVREYSLPHFWLGKLLRFRREDVLRWVGEQVALSVAEAEKAAKQKGAA